MNSKIIVACHKPYSVPDNKLYLPVQVGAAGKDSIGFVRDDQGENISDLNPYYSELTGLYWAWKNLEFDALGLVHYRRYFKGRGFGSSEFELILDEEQARKLLEISDVIVPKPQRYVIETIGSHYEHTHDGNDLKLARDVLEKMHPDYVADFDWAMERRSGHMFNMFIMKKDLVNEYCEFLFPFLEEVRKNARLDQCSAFAARMPGRIGELMLDVWIHHNHLKVSELPLIYTENINWPRKISSFLKAKFFHKRYNESF